MLAHPSFAFPLSASPPQLYRQFFTPQECRLLDRVPPNSALTELHMLRCLLARVVAAAGRKPRFGLQQRSAMLALFCRVAFTLASLARFEHRQHGPGPALLDLLYPEDDLSPL